MKLAKLTLLFLVAFSLSLLSSKSWEVDRDVLFNPIEEMYAADWMRSQQITRSCVASATNSAP